MLPIFGGSNDQPERVREGICLSEREVGSGQRPGDGIEVEGARGRRLRALFDGGAPEPADHWTAALEHLAAAGRTLSAANVRIPVKSITHSGRNRSPVRSGATTGPES